MRGRWSTLVAARWRVLGMGLVGVAGCQLAYFAAVQRVAVSTAILIEYMAPLLLVGFVWASSRRMPKVVVLVGSVVAVVGLVLVVSPGGGTFDVLGLAFAAIAAVGCAIYYVIAARPNLGFPPVALAASGLLLGGIVLGLTGLAGLVPFTATFGEVQLAGSPTPWWVPLLIVAVVATAFAYVANITASGMLGSRLASFAGLLEVIAAAVYAWILLGEDMTLWQLLGGALILGGIAFVRSEKTDASLEELPAQAMEPVPVQSKSG